MDVGRIATLRVNGDEEGYQSMDMTDDRATPCLRGKNDLQSNICHGTFSLLRSLLVLNTTLCRKNMYLLQDQVSMHCLGPLLPSFKLCNSNKKV